MLAMDGLPAHLKILIIGAVCVPLLVQVLPGHRPVDAVRVVEEVLLGHAGIEEVGLGEQLHVVFVHLQVGLHHEEASVEVVGVYGLRAVAADAFHDAAEDVGGRDGVRGIVCEGEVGSVLLRGGVVEYAVEGVEEEGVGVEAENSVVVGQRPELEFGEDGGPGDAADAFRYPVNYDVLDRYDLGPFFCQEGTLVLGNFRRHQNEKRRMKIAVPCVDRVPDLVVQDSGC